MSGRSAQATAAWPLLVWIAAAGSAGVAAGFLGVYLDQTQVLIGVVGLVAAVAAYSAFKSPLAAIGFALVALPMDIYGRILDRPVPITVYQLTLLLALASWAMAVLFGRLAAPRFGVVDAAMLALVGAGVWSLPNSLAPQATTLAIVRLVFIWAFVALVANVPRDRRDVRVLLMVLASVSAVHALVGISQALVPGLGIGNIHVQGPPGLRSLARVSGFFDDPNYYGGMLGAGSVAACALALHAVSRRQRLIWAGVAAVCTAALLATFSRSAWVAFAAAAVVLVISSPPAIRRWLVPSSLAAMVALVIAVGAVAPGAIIERFQSSTDIQGDTSVATRAYMAASMVDMVRDDPVWGTGLAAFQFEYPYYRDVASSRTILKPHQIPGGLASEAGLAGILAFSMLVAAVVMLVRRTRGRPMWLGESAALAGLAFMFVQSLFQYYLYFEYLWVFFGLLSAAVRVGATGEDVT